VKTWIVSTLLSVCLCSIAHGMTPVPQKAVVDDSCTQQQQAFTAASAEYDKDHSASKTFFRSFSQGGARASVSLHDAQMKTALDDLTTCRASVARNRRDAQAQAERDAYDARPEVRARADAIDKANAVHDGFVDVATFTPTEWLRGMGLTQWIPLGKSESKAFFYTYVSKNFETYINIKMATLGAGDDYILLEFMSSQIDCRPGRGYPAALPMPMTYSYNIHGIPMMNDYTSPFGTEVPVEHGTVLAAAVIGTCDAVRANNGTVNYQ
jgi:hypothetical protein